MEAAEALVARDHPAVTLAVGLHPGYRAAQRMYILRGYVPDGRGVTYRDKPVAEGDQATFDDDLVLHLTKPLSSGPAR